MRYLRLLGAAALAALITFGGAGLANAQTQQAETFTLEPGGTATITFEAFCTDFGLAFPDSVQVPNALGEPAVRGALAYIEQQGYAANEQNALEAQYGLWRAVGAADSPQGGAIAGEVVNASANTVADPQGTSLLQAAQAGQVRVTVSSWQPVGQPVQLGTTTDNFFGRGTLTVENISNEALTLYHPVGALYPPATAGEQTMAGYATDVQVNNPAAAQPTAQPTQQATAQPTQQATAQPTQQATAQPAQQATAQPAQQATAQPTQQATAQPTQQPTQLPNTGAEDSAPWLPGLALASLMLIGAGWALWRRSTTRA